MSGTTSNPSANPTTAVKPEQTFSNRFGDHTNTHVCAIASDTRSRETWALTADGQTLRVTNANVRTFVHSCVWALPLPEGAHEGSLRTVLALSLMQRRMRAMAGMRR